MSKHEAIRGFGRNIHIVEEGPTESSDMRTRPEIMQRITVLNLAIRDAHGRASGSRDKKYIDFQEQKIARWSNEREALRWVVKLRQETLV